MPTYRWFIILLLALLLAACGEQAVPPAPATAASSPTPRPRPEEAEESPAALAEAIEALLAEHGVPGAAVAVVSADELLFAEGFGVRSVESGEPVDTETLFHIGSTHKALTALLVGTLVEEGLFDWDTPVVEIVPDFALSDPEATQRVRVRDLLAMSSGIPAEAEDDFDETSSPADLFDYVAEVELLAMPGEEFSYSNLSSALSGYVAVLATGGDYESLYEGYRQLLQLRVLDPIGMADATLLASEAQANPNHAEPHILEAGGPLLVDSYDVDGDPLAPSGSLKAHIRDMARFIQTQLRRGVSPHGRHVIAEAPLTEAWRPNESIGDGRYGMGWEATEIEGERFLWHDGAYDNFTSLMGFFPDADVGFVVLTNVDESEEFMEALQALLLPYLLDE